ncbi:Ig-like domain-containing protein [Dokdonella soli]|uniref:Fibronectin type-III domain-containing protein n=1 Tax=Dokdonella soli TaxID=529810 RepID=A0ABN1IH12_9GAMM
MRTSFTAFCLATCFAALTPGLLRAAQPATGTVSDANPLVHWNGDMKTATAAACGSPHNAACDNFLLTVSTPGYPFQVKITQTAGAADDWDLEVYGPDGTLVGKSGNGPGTPETVVLLNPVAGTYTVASAPYAPVTAYKGSAELTAVTGGGGGVNGTEPLAFRVYAPLGLTEPDAHWDAYAPSAGASSIGLSAGEPTLGVPVKHNLNLQQVFPTQSRVMYLAGLQTLRLVVDSMVSPAIGTWSDKSSPTHKTSLDPILEVDPISGRTISTQLAGKRSIMSLSDNEGDTWSDSPQGSGINSGVDHQTIGTGKFPTSDPVGGLNGYPTATYYASQDIAAAEAGLSRDGGTTWAAAVPMYAIATCGGLHGHIEVAPNGNVFVPNRNCGGDAGFARSGDSGTTWQVIKVAGIGGSSSDPGIAAGADGTLYYGQCGRNNAAALIAVSTDNGDHWSAPLDVGAPLGIKNCVFATMVAGDGDRAAFAFLGSSTAGAAATGADPNAWSGNWYLYVATTYDRGLTWTTVTATQNDPVQKGPVCLAGTTCASNRNLLDFMDVQKDEKGRVYVGFADGCIGGCVTGGHNSGTAYTRVARQEPGSRSLYAAFDSEFKPSAPVAPLQPYLEAIQTGNQTQARVNVTWARPWDGRSPLTGYRVLRRVNPGGSYGQIASVGANVRDYVDTTVQMNTGYCYQVQAVNAVGASALAYEACAVQQVAADPCTAPGAQRGTDPAGDQIGGNQLDIRALFLGEPFLGDPLQCKVSSPQKLVFTVDVTDASTTTAGNAWIVLWNRVVPDASCTPAACDREMVNARMTATGVECHVGKIVAPNSNLGNDAATLAAGDCELKPNGTLTISVPTHLIDDCSGSGCSIGPGYQLAGLEVRTFNSNVSGQPVTSTTAADTAPALSYQMIGNDMCRPVGKPLANDDHFSVDLDQPSVALHPLANDQANSCDALTITSVGQPASGTVSISADKTTLVYQPSGTVCEDHFAYTIANAHGDTAHAVVVVHHDHTNTAGVSEYIFAEGFDGGHICPNPNLP